MKSVFEVARQLAEAHKVEDPETTDIFIAAANDEVRLVEVSGSLGASTSREVLPFRFNAQPEQGIDYPSVVVLLSPSEWDAVKRGELTLPSGWDRDTLEKVG
jgi:hypothetical protein